MKLPVCLLALLLITAPHLTAQDGEATRIRVTHGPLLGRPASDSMTVWARTNYPGEVRLLFGTDEKNLDQSATFTTELSDDNTGTLTLDGLKPRTEYFYRLDNTQLSGSFRTLNSADEVRNAEYNPDGLFNLRFEFACGNNQSGNGNSVGPVLPVYDTLNRDVRETIDFGILNGDWLYEEDRDFPADLWARQVGLDPLQLPAPVDNAPTITGVWENYKTYLHRARNLSEWHRHVPTPPMITN